MTTVIEKFDQGERCARCPHTRGEHGVSMGDFLAESARACWKCKCSDFERPPMPAGYAETIEALVRELRAKLPDGYVIYVGHAQKRDGTPYPVVTSRRIDVLY